MNLEITWLKDGVEIDLVREGRYDMDVVTKSLTIRGARVDDSSTYTCLADNGIDTDEVTASLVVRGKGGVWYTVQSGCVLSHCYMHIIVSRIPDIIGWYLDINSWCQDTTLRCISHWYHSDISVIPWYQWYLDISDIRMVLRTAVICGYQSVICGYSIRYPVIKRYCDLWILL